MFKPTLLRFSMIAALLAFATTTSMWAQTESKSTTQKTAAKKFRGRLPNYYGQIGLSRKQRTDIYAIQEKYHLQIDELEAKLEELKLKQSEEIYAVLTPAQKESLKTLKERRRGSRAKTAASETEEE